MESVYIVMQATGKARVGSRCGSTTVELLNLDKRCCTLDGLVSLCDCWLPFLSQNSKEWSVAFWVVGRISSLWKSCHGSVLTAVDWASHLGLISAETFMSYWWHWNWKGTGHSGSSAEEKSSMYTRFSDPQIGRAWCYNECNKNKNK